MRKSTASPRRTPSSSPPPIDARADLLTCDAHFAKLPRVVYVAKGIAMNGRPFFVPMIGIVLLFAALGPAVGGALFIPLSIVFKTPTDLEAIGLMVLISTFFGHALGLIAAYIVGVGPAAATGFLYALWDAVAPGARAARARRRSHWRPARLWPPLAPQPGLGVARDDDQDQRRALRPATGLFRAASASRSAMLLSLAPRSRALSAHSPQTSSGSPCDRN